VSHSADLEAFDFDNGRSSARSSCLDLRKGTKRRNKRKERRKEKEEEKRRISVFIILFTAKLSKVGGTSTPFDNKRKGTTISD
jgi:hypothetical protein